MFSYDSCNKLWLILGALARLRKATIYFAMPVCLSARVEQTVFHWTDFHEIWYLRIFENLSEEFKFY
jgi:hypothetical protein